MILKKNDLIELNIENCGLDGSGAGHYEGMTVFVQGAITGEKILVHIIKVKKTYAIGKIERILTASPYRIESPCKAYNKCGGCSFCHTTYESEISAKEQHVKECFKRIGGIEPEFEPTIKAKEIFGYRNKAQFPVSENKGEISIGFYSPRSHRVVNCPDCLLQPAEFELILNCFKEYIEENHISIYSEENHKGLLRHIYLRKGTVTGEIMVCPVINGNELPKEKELVNSLISVCDKIKSIIININTNKTNVILGKKCRTIYGNDFITDTLCSINFRLSPLSFYQVNHNQAEKLYYKAAEYAELTGCETVLDLYCGTGTIGLSMANKAKNIIGVEIIPEAIEDAKINAKNNNIHNSRFICGDAPKAAEILKNEGVKPNVIILDPPRKGCAKELLETVNEMNPDRIVYVSCDPATLARDCGILSEMGYVTEKATAVDLFPRTGHVETVVSLSQQTPKMTVDVTVDLDEFDTTPTETKATYKEIEDYIFKKYKLKVSNLYIAQIKQKYGIIERENYNKPKSANSKQPKCPPEKEKIIVEALRHFQMI